MTYRDVSIPGVIEPHDPFNTIGAPTEILYNPEWEEAAWPGKKGTTQAPHGNDYDDEQNENSTTAA